MRYAFALAVAALSSAVPSSAATITRNVFNGGGDTVFAILNEPITLAAGDRLVVNVGLPFALSSDPRGVFSATGSFVFRSDALAPFTRVDQADDFLSAAGIEVTFRAVDNTGKVFENSFTNAFLFRTFDTREPLITMFFPDIKASALTSVSFILQNGPQFQLDVNRVQVNADAVPEPASWAMMIGGFALIGAAARRRVRIAYAHA